MYSKLQYISQGATAEAQLENIKSALDAGCEWIQLRFKNSDTKQLAELSERVRLICTSYKATFILNDHVAIAKSIEADGVHLGLEDMSVEKARNILGDNKIIGGTANTLTDVVTRINEQCDYIGLGPLRFTSTKEKLSPVVGIEGYRHITSELSKLRLTQIAIYAIGGITLDDVTALMHAGVYGVAASGAITNPQNKKELLQRFNSLLYEKVNYS